MSNDTATGLLLGWARESRGRPDAKSMPAAPIWHRGEGHLLTVAPTGAGKGVSCIIPALLSWDGPLAVIDPKGENYAVTAAYRRSIGQQVEVLDPFGITDAPRPARLNPLDLIDIASPSAADEATVIGGLLMQEGTSREERFWDERATVLITGLILDLMRSAAPKTLGNVRGMLESLVDRRPPGIDVLYCDWFSNEPCLDIKAALSIINMPSEKTRSSIFATASSHISFLKAGPVLECVTDSTIDLDDIREGAPLTIYMVLPPDKLVTHGKLLRLWLGVILNTITSRRRIPEKPTLLLVDEAAQLGRLDQLRTALTLLRGYGVKVWTFWQDFSQISSTYSDWHSILNNSSVQQFFGPTTPVAAQLLELYLCRHGGLVNGLTPQDMILLHPGSIPRRVQRPSYLADRLFAGRASHNPFYGKPSCPYANENFIDLFGGRDGQ